MSESDMVGCLRVFAPAISSYLPFERDVRKVFGSNGEYLRLGDLRRAADLIASFDAGQAIDLQDLVVALKPFAAIADTFLEEFPDSKGVTAIDATRWNLGHFRHARLLVSAHSGSPAPSRGRASTP